MLRYVAFVFCSIIMMIMTCFYSVFMYHCIYQVYVGLCHSRSYKYMMIAENVLLQLLGRRASRDNGGSYCLFIEALVNQRCRYRSLELRFSHIHFAQINL